MLTRLNKIKTSLVETKNSGYISTRIKPGKHAQNRLGMYFWNRIVALFGVLICLAFELKSVVTLHQ